MTPIFTPFEAESAEYLRLRVARVGWIAGIATLLFILSQLLFFTGQGWSDLYAHSNILFSAAGAVCLLLMWAFARREGTRTRSIQVAETLGVIGACGCFTAAFIEVPKSTRPELLATFILTCSLVLRAAIIPSTKLRTFLISTLVGGFLLGFAYLKYADQVAIPDLEDPFEAFLQSRAGILSNVATLWAIATAACVSISGIVYGLRREIHRHKQLGQYQLLERLGEGGMGVVYRARHAMLKRPTAIKLLLPEKISAAALARFEREVQLAAKLRHPNTVTIYDYGHSPEGIFYFAMELLEGASAETMVRQHGRMPPERVIHLLVQVSKALHEAHGVGLIHRDITPANIMICRHAGELDVAKIVDFGLAREIEVAPESRLSQAGEVSGTPLYMAPECITRPEQVDGRCDVYSLGAVAFYLLTGEHAFQGGSLMEICSKQLLDEPPRLKHFVDEIPDSLEAILRDCLAKDPNHRPPDGAALASRLLECRDVGAWTANHASDWWKDHATDPLIHTDPDLIPKTIQMALDVQRLPKP